jgi:YbdK family carboxylate-amine ligase
VTQAVGQTVGVEEEYHLVDADTLRLTDVPGVVASAHRLLGGDAQSEISTSQLEVATPVCRSLSEVREQLARLRRGADAAAREHGARVLASGTPPIGCWTDQRLTSSPRYIELFERWRLLALQQLVAGCHVHVHVGDDELAVRVLDRLRPDLPVLLALSGSSPFWEGSDSGYASYRTQWFARFPVTGPTELLGDRAGYDALLADLVGSGIVPDATHLYWDARPSTRFPTVEIRVADACPRLDDVVLHAGLARSLVRVAAAEALRDVDFPRPRGEVLRAARWRAARGGLEGELVDLRTGELVPAPVLVRRLLERLRDDLEAAREWDEVAGLAQQALARGTSAARQRAVMTRTGDLEEVVRVLVEHSVAV